ncbi:unnamed protein product [Spirodela intermedia]|uniref:Thioredoxin domain-containing protein n=2 Tax=Spirodela intermedia TaxID=51605 RepID=A0A7I8J431_SPIIN|nr:unnamed protein product [Spirodela intermedia]CAA6664110.1 unnamed protein product [Spirodela intermedia]CAA7400633.1 unnamed protein product [Spirodela intermedia]
MALQMQISVPSLPSSSTLRSRALGGAAAFSQADGSSRGTGTGWSKAVSTAPPAAYSGYRGRRTLSIRPVRSSLDIAAPTVGTVTEVDKDTFWPLVKAAGDKLVVLDMYTQWCGPCKLIAPKYQGLSEKHLDVMFLKLDCNKENRPLAKELGIRVVPTFKILKDGQVVKEVTGAKLDDLVLAIETARSS